MATRRRREIDTDRLLQDVINDAGKLDQARKELSLQPKDGEPHGKA